MLEKAAKYAVKEDRRGYIIGAVGKRSDGAIIYARNLPAETLGASHHAEYRLAKKSDVDTVVYIARIRRDNGEWANARPCRSCRNTMKARGIKHVYYTTDPGEYSYMNLETWIDDEIESTGERLKPFELGRWRRGPS